MVHQVRQKVHRDGIRRWHYDASGTVRDAVTSALRDIILTLDLDGSVVASTVRKVHVLAARGEKLAFLVTARQ